MTSRDDKRDEDAINKARSLDAWNLYCGGFHSLFGEDARVELSPAAIAEFADRLKAQILSVPSHVGHIPVQVCADCGHKNSYSQYRCEKCSSRYVANETPEQLEKRLGKVRAFVDAVNPETTPSTTACRPLPLPDEITAATQLYRAEITKRMETSHPSASPSIESMTITLRDLFEKMEKRGAFAASAMGERDLLQRIHDDLKIRAEFNNDEQVVDLSSGIWRDLCAYLNNSPDGGKQT